MIFNNTLSIIKGDEEDYEHEVQVSIKYKESDTDAVELPFNEEFYLFNNKSLTRTQTLSWLPEISYLFNINLRPDLFANSSIIVFTKSVSGNITLDAKLDIKSIVILFLSILILIGLVLQALASIFQFIRWKY